MEVDHRVPFLENWVIIGLITQVLLIGVVHFRIFGQWSVALKKRGNSSVLIDKPFDRTSIWLLILNAFLGGVVLLTSLLSSYYYFKSSLGNAIIVAFSFLLLWHLDYLTFWIFSKKSFLEPLLVGNIQLYILGIFVFGVNVVHFFKLTNGNMGLILVVSFLFFFLLRTFFLALRLNSLGFSWYYFILYFCTVYVIPSVLISKYYESQWLEFLTP